MKSSRGVSKNDVKQDSNRFIKAIINPKLRVLWIITFAVLWFVTLQTVWIGLQLRFSPHRTWAGVFTPTYVMWIISYMMAAWLLYAKRSLMGAICMFYIGTITIILTILSIIKLDGDANYNWDTVWFVACGFVGGAALLFTVAVVAICIYARIMLKRRQIEENITRLDSVCGVDPL